MTIPHIQAADAALQSIHTRNTSTGQWVPVGVYFYEVEALEAFIDIHGFQLKQICRGEFNQAADRVFTQTKAAGGQIEFETTIQTPESIAA